MSPGQASEALTDENSDVSDRSDDDLLPGLIDEYDEEDVGPEIMIYTILQQISYRLGSSTT
jgi:hypothetical protein